MTGPWVQWIFEQRAAGRSIAGIARRALLVQANDIGLISTPTNASWLNWIEAEFAALRYFSLGGTDHRSHDEQGQAIGDYIRWHNQRARPKQEFAIDSRIREPDYMINVA